MSYLHFKCPSCQKVYALEVDSLNPKKTDKVAAPDCVRCKVRTKKSGAGAKRARACAVILTAAALERQKLNLRLAAQSAKRNAIVTKNRGLDLDDEIGSESDIDEDDPEDEDYLETPSHGFNIRMRLTPGPYLPRPDYQHDTNNTLRQVRNILGTAGRGVLNTIMANHLGATGKPQAYSAWRHAGTTQYSLNKFQSSEWCHLVADSLGGPSTPDNLVAGSYSANTYMAAMEALLKGQSGLTISVNVHCHAVHVAEWIIYKITHRNSGREYRVEIDGTASGFSALDLQKVQTALQAWLGLSGIKVNLSP